LAALAAFVALPAFAQMTLSTQPFAKAYTPIPFVSPANFAASLLKNAREAQAIRDFCSTMRTYYKKYGWHDDPCGHVKWRADLRSKNGHPLIYAAFGRGTETTLILGGVHANELTPMHLAFRAARYLDEHPGTLNSDVRAIIAPLVNPDGFLRTNPTRTNADGIDLNRNLFTLDWYDKAHRLWSGRRHRVLAHFPGYFPNSEVETIFQIRLIDRFHPDKILSIHAPLGFLDYDGPGAGQLPHPTRTEVKARRLVKAISEKSKNYKVEDYTFYPGSLGNYAGNERHIPTVTLELETTQPKLVDAYWKQFWPGILESIHYQYKAPATLEALGNDNASPFSALYCPIPDKTI